MLNYIILWSLRNRLVVLVLAVLLIVFGVRAAIEAPLDVFPDFAPPQVVIQTEAATLSAEEVEQLVTFPIESSLNGTSNLQTIRSSSAVGLSVITCVFEMGTDIFRARQLVNEKLQLAIPRLPQGVGEPQMMLFSLPVGIILKMSLRSDQTSLMELRSFADWTLRPRLLAVPGVAQVTIFGGEVKQYQVIVDPAKLKDFGVTLQEVMTAARGANQNAGAGFLDQAGQTLAIQGVGRVRSLSDLENAAIAIKSGIPVKIKQVARVVFGAEYKVGDSTTFGRPSVNIIILKQPWVNTLTTTRAVDAALSELRRSLPPDVVMDTGIFRQSDFIERAISNINISMLQGGLLVLLVLLLFLFNWRTGLISLIAIPLSLLAAVVILRELGGTINAMTLGGLAIALGEVVDDAIIDVENVFRRLRENRLKLTPVPALLVIYRASSEVRGSVVYATVIVALVFLPIVSLSGLAGRIFAPLAHAYVISILASLVVALVVTPALCYLLLARMPLKSEDSLTVCFLKRSYRHLLEPALHHWKKVATISLLLLAGALGAIPFITGEFLPEFNEGNLIIHMTGIPGTSLEESVNASAIVQERLAEIPEVVKLAAQTGRAELSEDTFGPYYTELDVNLQESSRSRKEVVTDVRHKLDDIRGFTFGIKQFISERIEEVLSGTTATVVVKLFGPDLNRLRDKGRAIQTAMAEVPGMADLSIEQQIGVPKVQVRFDREALAQVGLNSAGLAETMRAAFFGTTVSRVFEQQRSFDILVRYEPEMAKDLQAIRTTLVDTPVGGKVPLGSLADIGIVDGPNMINRENAQRRIVVSANISSGSLSQVVAAIKQKIADRVRLPTGYYIVYGGQYEAQRDAYRQILLMSGVAASGIFLLLFLAFRSVRQSLLVMVNLPLALIGGVAAVFLISQGSASIGSLVGFVTLFGIATRNGIMLITHYNHLIEQEGMKPGRELVIRGAMERLSPILMTALTAGLGLLPLALGGGKPGRELEQPMAVVILGGLVTSTLLNMVVLPALFLKYGRPPAVDPSTIFEVVERPAG